MQLVVWMRLCFVVALFTIAVGASGQTHEEIFSKQVYQVLSRLNQEKNVVYSPWSLVIAIEMLYHGASGETLAELNRLGSGNSSNAGTFTASRGRTLSQPVEIALNLTAGLYHQEGLSIKPGYLTSIENTKSITKVIEKCNFRGDPEGCRSRINEWVAKNTGQKIPSLIKDGIINTRTVAVLASAVYFKAPWETAFPSYKIRSLPFHRFGRENDRQNVPFLEDTRSCLYKESANSVAVAIPYKINEFFFCIVLPKKRDGLTEIEGEVQKQCFEITSGNAETVVLKIPKFKIKQNVDLKEVLKSLGIKTMFSEAANFERMTDAKIMISDAVHEAFIDVNENGTEAAAASGFAVQSLSVTPPPKPFVADHPFFYAIMHKRIRIPLFAGKVLSIE